MHRIFAALPVPADITERLIPLRAEIAGARWRQREHFHITLQFYGEVKPDIAEDIADALERISAPVLSLQLAGVGWFGRKEPHSLYARIADDEALRGLAHDCHRIARKLGVRTDARPFKPHITLAYCHLSPLPDVMAWSEDKQALSSDPFFVDRFHLFESFTSRSRQSRYEAQATYPLG